MSSQIFPSFSDGLYLSTMMGCSKSGNSPLTIRYADRPHEKISANYNNRCFEDSHWWSFRLENWAAKTGWGFELIHHKIYLDNTTDTIRSFSVSDGYNLFFMTYAKQINDYNFRIGFGGVLAHVDVLIEGRERYIRKGLTGHYLTGPALQLNLERILWQNSTHFLSFDSKFTVAYAEVPISSNNTELASVPDYALHFSIALGSKPVSFNRNQPLKKQLLYFAPLIYPVTVGHVIGTGLLPGGY
ncbi:MAG: hypothetical protein ACON35_08755 [Candidatus Marinamargulisbacteria bacterium]